MKNKPSLINEALTLMDSDQSQEFVEEFHHSLNEAIEKTRGKYTAQIESAVELHDEEKKQITNLLETILKSKLRFQFSVNPRLLAGFKITVGDWKLDASITNQLEFLARRLKNFA